MEPGRAVKRTLQAATSFVGPFMGVAHLITLVRSCFRHELQSVWVVNFSYATSESFFKDNAGGEAENRARRKGRDRQF